MDRLRVALDEVSVVDPGEDIYNPMVGPVRLLVDEPIVRAARALVDAETVWWCESHEASQLIGLDRCGQYLFAEPLFAGDPDPGACSMVERLLVDPGKLQ